MWDDLLGVVKVPRVVGRLVIEGRVWKSRSALRSWRYRERHKVKTLRAAKARRDPADYVKGGKYFVSYADRKARGIA